MPPLLALESVTLEYGTRAVLDGVSVGIGAGDRIGVVGRNGGGKSTLLGVLAGVTPMDSGRVIRTSAETLLVGQSDALVHRDGGAAETVRDVVVGRAPEHEWAADPRVRDVLDGLLGGVEATFFSSGMQTPIMGLSGGERRRLALAAALVAHPDVLLLDEPTNHLDIESVAWLARRLTGPQGPSALVTVTHDRWFLDEVATQTWEVAGGQVNRFDGGYAAWVLAKAERQRMAASSEERRLNLARKELAWLRRGPPARTSKPKFRIDAANALIADVPPPRDRLELQKFATTRLGRKVVDLEDVDIRVPGRDLLKGVTWQLGPGDRVGLLGPNGAGKSTFLNVLDGSRPADGGTVDIGKTVKAAHLRQILPPVDPDDRVLPSLERVRTEVEVGKGRVMTASSLLEGFGFTGDLPYARLGDLSGGERRRFELLRLLVESPNLLILDEPTNDLDVETLAVLEDVLDTWPGSLVVVSHDRYFLERTCDDIYMLGAEGTSPAQSPTLRHLPGGVDDYLALRGEASRSEVSSREASRSESSRSESSAREASSASPPAAPKLTGGQAHALRKELTRIERRMEKLRSQTQTILDKMAEAGTDHEALRSLDESLQAVKAEEEEAELAWLEVAEQLEG